MFYTSSTNLVSIMAYISFLSALITITQSCTKLILHSTDPGTEWINATYIMEPTIISGGRPVYIEQLHPVDEGEKKDDPRALYHYSREELEDDDISADYKNADFDGRWVLGSNIYSPNGWSYIPSWSISPADNMMHSLVNADFEIDPKERLGVEEGQIHPKLRWRQLKDKEWHYDITGQMTVSCDTKFDDIKLDWLFISTPNRYEFNILNEDIPQKDQDLLHSITRDTLYGFYYRVSDEYWRKIESSIYLRRRDLSGGKTKEASSIWSSVIGGSDETRDTEFSFLFYDGFTNRDGTPNLEEFEGFVVATNASSADFNALEGKEWTVMDSTGSEYQKEKHYVDIVTIKDEDDDIYSAFRRYWRKKKLEAFNAVADDKGWTEEQRNKIIVDTNNGLPFMMLGLGMGGLNEQDSKKSMNWAMNDIGYRVIDGAQAYFNEGPLGTLLQKKRKVAKRDDLYIISKVWPTHLGFVQTYNAILDSLNLIRTNYLDLYMIHWNRCDPSISWMDCKGASGRPWGQSWEVMERLYAEGILHSIGISNYNFNDFNEILTSSRMQIVPQLIQNYCDIAHIDWDLANYTKRASGTIYQGYAQYRGLAGAEYRAKRGEPHYLEAKTKLEEIANRVEGEEKPSASQILLRFLMEKGIATIPRSSKKEHLKENFDVFSFDLTEEDIESILTLSQKQNKDLRRKSEL